MNIPIINILLADLPNSFYVTNGFETKRTTSPIRKALIWFNNDGMSFADFELEAINILLSEKNVQIDIFDKEHLTKENFLKIYQDTTYDLV